MDIFEKMKTRKILLIDDDESIRIALNTFFRHEGMQIDVLATAEDGIEAVQKSCYDIIIADFSLPGIDGLSFLNLVRILSPDAFRILITSCLGENILNEARALKIDAFIQKPITADLLKEAFSRLSHNTSS